MSMRCWCVASALCSTDLSSANVCANSASTNCWQAAEGTWFLLSSSLTQLNAASPTPASPSLTGRQPNVAKWNSLLSRDAGAWLTAVSSGVQLNMWDRQLSDCRADVAALLSNVRRWRSWWDIGGFDSPPWRNTPVNQHICQSSTHLSIINTTPVSHHTPVNHQLFHSSSGTQSTQTVQQSYRESDRTWKLTFTYCVSSNSQGEGKVNVDLYSTLSWSHL